MKTDKPLIGAFLDLLAGPHDEPVADLLDRVLRKSREITGAEAGAIFLVRGKGKRRVLETICHQLRDGRARHAPPALPIDGRSIAGYVAATGRTLRVADAYRIGSGLPYRHDARWDRRVGYATRTMLVFALRDEAGETIGVVQLANRRSARGHGPLRFGSAQARIIAPANRVVAGAIERAALLDRMPAQRAEVTRGGRRVAALRAQTEAAFQHSIRLLARAAELYDQTTARHLSRVNEYSYWLARKLAMPDAWCAEMRFSAQLHDVGKLSVDIDVLRKNGELDAKERAEMNRHPEYGWNILRANPRLQMAAEIAYCHHERWDGSGYPRGLRGGTIPLSARIVQIADVYDALRSARPYKPGLSHREAVEIILEGDARIDPARDFDPGLLDVFARHHRSFDRIWQELLD